jgi:hypothetical protein
MLNLNHIPNILRHAFISTNFAKILYSMFTGCTCIQGVQMELYWEAV